MNQEQPSTLLQSQRRVLAFLRTHIKWFNRLSSPKAKVRMLLFDPKEAEDGQFGSDWPRWHAERIRGTHNRIEQIKEDHPDFVVNVDHYKAMPSVSAVIINNNIVCLSWYRSYFDGNVMRLRGHNSAAITG